MTTEKFDPYQAVTDQVIALLEAGVAPWRKPWSAEFGMPRSLTTGKVYRGINPLLLAMSAAEKGFTSPFWITYKAATERGGQVRKGSKSTLVIFWKQFLDKVEVDKNGNPKARFVLRTYRVFNLDQIDPQEGEAGAKWAQSLPEIAMPAADHDPIADCEAVAAAYLVNGPAISFGAGHAAYSPTTDHLVMPDLSAFDSAEEYYSTLFHELTHSTGHKDRLNREGVTGATHFGDALYSKEELVAEMGAAFLAGHTGIAPATLENSASYLQSWIKVLKGDSKLIVQAAAQAQRAADLVQGVSFAERTATEAA